MVMFKTKNALSVFGSPKKEHIFVQYWSNKKGKVEWLPFV